MKPQNLRDPLTKNGTLCQHMLLQFLKYYLRDLSNFEKSNPSYSLVSNITWKYFFHVRAFLQSYKIIELSELNETDNPPGIMITVSVRPKIYDAIIVYVPNIPLFGSEPYFYAEYLATLHSSLLLEGFNSPAILILKFPEFCKESTMENNLKFLIESWIKISKQHHNSKLILMGDSIGATLILHFLSIKKGIFPNADLSRRLNCSKINIDPFAVLLISPIVKFNVSTKKQELNNCENSVCYDFLKQDNITDFSAFYCKNKKYDKYNPVKWNKVLMWEKLVPKFGMVIFFGDQELQSKEIEQMCRIAFETQRVKVVKSEKKCHSWQFVSFLTERTQKKKEHSCLELAHIISRMLIYQTPAYRDQSANFQSN